ncbi:PleD family two-component system response regulator [Methylobacter sp. S3L5C]|uniref:response regulator n=1 Tax=Methylobacter sp. S3L5C TaxID=2839024 RepID=UPI001FAE5287|nr:response regulator [Methylobacter sp. S3L5C]UOA08207.1 response regulator [Methylobacter sp. S3L5C]
MLIDNKQTTIVVIDDDVLQHKIINNCLKDEPYKIISLLRGETALTFLLMNRPDLILLDINMPDFSGIEILQRIKSYKHLSGVPIIMVTGDKNRDTIIECIKKGATNYIIKPFTRSLLIEKVGTALTTATLATENDD